MDFVASATLALLIKKLIDFLRYASARDVNGVVTQLTTWVAGIAGTLLAAQTGWAGEISVGGVPLSALNFWSLVFVGLTIASTASVVQDVTKAVDNTNSAKIPALLPDTTNQRAE